MEQLSDFHDRNISNSELAGNLKHMQVKLTPVKEFDCLIAMTDGMAENLLYDRKSGLEQKRERVRLLLEEVKGCESKRVSE